MTHGGERFLARQLQSILAQTRLPALLVAVDDVSTDQSRSILRDMARVAPSRNRYLASTSAVADVSASAGRSPAASSAGSPWCMGWRVARRRQRMTSNRPLAAG